MPRIFLVLIAVMSCAQFTASPAQAESVYFVSVAKLAEGKQRHYDRFLKAVAPIWKRHGMEVLLRARTVDAVTRGDVSGSPTEIGVLRVDSYENFQAYFADPDYSKIKQSRLDAVDNFVVLEGKAINIDGLSFLAKAPMAATVFNTTAPSNTDPSLELEISGVGQVKGPVGEFLKQVKNIQIHALSFDDNPSEYLPQGDAATLLLIGEIVRP